MSKALGMRCVWGLCGVLASALLFASATQAEVSTDLSGTVLVFPKVVWTGFDTGNSRDTVIQISNTSNQLVHAHCFYVNAQRTPQGTALWQVTDFSLWLTRQQPTHWVASQGRFVNPFDSCFGHIYGDEEATGGYLSPADLCDGAGLDPGAIPPVPPGFAGELKCIQVDASGVPFGGNNLKGEAVIRRADGDVSKYNAIALLATDLVSDDNVLRLDNPLRNDEEGEVNSCPNSLLLDHFVDGAPDPVVSSLNDEACGDGICPIRTDLTLVPCTEDFENLIPSRVTVQFAITNEFEEPFSTSTTVDCWLSTRLADIASPTGACTGSGGTGSGAGAPCVTDDQCFDLDAGFCEKSGVFSFGTLGTATAFTTITPVADDGGVLGVAEEIHYNSAGVGAWASWNLQQEGTRFDATLDEFGEPTVDTITIPQQF
jgi:hypothetical protein